MKKFLLRAILYTGYLNLTAWVVVGLPVLIIGICFFWPFGRSEEYALAESAVWECILAILELLLIYFFIILFSIKGIKSTKKILRGDEPSIFDVLCIVLMIIAGILFCAWMVRPYS